MNIKNKIVLLVSNQDNEKEKIELFNFSKLEHYGNGEKLYFRILCDSKYYYFLQSQTSIIKIENY